ncbi:MAG: hypothetical protein ACKO3G_00480 [Planctomycetaceae bacterium]
MTLASVTPKGAPEGPPWLDDGRQVPLFIPVPEEFSKQHLERSQEAP